MIPESLIRAATDHRLGNRDLAIYTYLHKLLDCTTFRPLKQSWLARQLQLHQPNVAWSLQRLVKLGYLKQKGRRQGVIASYRIPLSPADDSLRYNFNGSASRHHDAHS